MKETRNLSTATNILKSDKSECQNPQWKRLQVKAINECAHKVARGDTFAALSVRLAKSVFSLEPTNWNAETVAPKVCPYHRSISMSRPAADQTATRQNNTIFIGTSGMRRGRCEQTNTYARAHARVHTLFMFIINIYVHYDDPLMYILNILYELP